MSISLAPRISGGFESHGVHQICIGPDSRVGAQYSSEEVRDSTEQRIG